MGTKIIYHLEPAEWMLRIVLLWPQRVGDQLNFILAGH